MDNQPVIPSPSPELHSANQISIKLVKTNNFLVPLLSVLLIVTVGIAGLFYFRIQKLSKELSKYQTQVSPSPSATTDPTAGWKTYTNTEFNYSFKYPQSWEIQEYPDADLPYVLHRLELRSNNKPQLVIETYKELRMKTVPEDKVVRSEQIAISGVTGTKNWHNSFGPPAEIIIIFDTKTYRILLQDANQNQTVDQILSTFKFTDANSQKIEKCLEEINHLGSSTPGMRGMANPAAVFCTCMGGTLEPRENDQGQYSLCKIDGKEYDEWEYFRKYSSSQ